MTLKRKMGTRACRDIRLQSLGLLPGLLGSHMRAVSRGGQGQRWGCAERGLVEKIQKLRGLRGCGDGGPDKGR